MSIPIIVAMALLVVTFSAFWAALAKQEDNVFVGLVYAAVATAIVAVIVGVFFVLGYGHATAPRLTFQAEVRK